VGIERGRQGTLDDERGEFALDALGFLNVQNLGNLAMRKMRQNTHDPTLQFDDLLMRRNIVTSREAHTACHHRLLYSLKALSL